MIYAAGYMSDIKGITVDNISRKEWSEFVSSHPYGNIFQTPEMYEVYEGTKNYEPLFVGAVDGRGTILGVLVSVVQKEFGGPLGSLTSRCVTWGGPLVRANGKVEERREILDFILKEQNRIAKKKAIYMQFRNLWDMSEYNEIFEKNGYEYEEHLNILIDLTKSEDEIWSGLSQSKRRSIRKARKANVHIINDPNLDQIREYYDLLEYFYKNIVKKPLPDWSFFKSLHEILGSKEMLKYFLVESEGQIIGGIVTPMFKGTLYEWYVYGDRNFSKKYPSEMATWAPIEWGMKNGYHTFDFMGAGKPDEEYGVRDFKMKFGGNHVEYGRYTGIHKKTKMKIAMAGLKAMKKVK